MYERMYYCIQAVKHPREAFPFLTLPAELRNRVYEYAAAGRIIQNPQRPTRLVRTTHQPAKKNTSESCIGLNTVCRQIRTEFRPLYMRRAKLVIDFHDLQSFTAAFFSKMKVGKAFPSKVTVMLNNYDRPCKANGDVVALTGSNDTQPLSRGCDVLSFLEARSVAHVVRWKFGEVRVHYDWCEPFTSNEHCKLFNMAAGLSNRKLFGYMKWDLFSSITYQKSYAMKPEWQLHFVVKFRLTDQEKDTFEQLCKQQQLPFEMVIVVKVKNLYDELREEYRWSDALGKLVRASSLEGLATGSVRFPFFLRP
ncbi:hypothetical protein CC86DRAFT_371813 [Ophiobolus disseminans]|uniref:F-box domain-containing protein n=1 Tax=Ophiobolus disseminans TaxID=1469910 RepID=A0A6A6ZVV2_9PLEO|nr:hypothetical protein CC86DRAFT_371813 [Ophiobolus disseminans]